MSDDPAQPNQDPTAGRGSAAVLSGAPDGSTKLDRDLYECQPPLTEGARLLEDIALAEEQIERGEGVDHEAARSASLTRLRDRQAE